MVYKMHEGHRERLKNRFIKEGLDGFEPHQILELLLFYAIPRRDTNELAHRLLERFGTINGVLEAEVNELVKVIGIGKNTAVLLKMMPELSRVYLKDKWRDKPLLDNSQRAGDYLVNIFTGRVKEVFFVLCLDTMHKLNYSAMVHQGTINEVPVYPRLIVESALRHNAAGVILAHNHPAGILKPSKADLDATKQIVIALEAISIQVLDHVIVAGDRYYSFADNRMIPRKGDVKNRMMQNAYSYK